MKTTILTAALVALMGAYASACPMHMEGVEKKVENTADGITITITSKDKAVVEKLQAHAKDEGGECCKAKMKGGKHEHGKADKATKGDKAAGFSCPMKGCYTGPNTKDGRCPHCGMKLEKKG